MNSLEQVKEPCLYICATPIGNLQDCTFRLINILNSVDLIAAEDTRVTRKLLEFYEINKVPLTSLQKFNECEKSQYIINVLSQGKQVALVSDAGTPNISDPGEKLIQAVISKGFKVSPVPGPSSVITAVSISGISGAHFSFLGFFPRKEKESLLLIGKYLPLNTPLVFFETAKRLLNTMTLIADNFPGSQIFLCKELTKKFETYYTGAVENILKKISLLAVTELKGEWCFVFLPLSKIEDNTADEVKALKQLALNRIQFQFICQHYLNISKNKSFQLYHDE